MPDTGSFLRHEACVCGSSDGLAVYTDHAYCFVCNRWFSGDGAEIKKPSSHMTGLLVHEPSALGARRISRDTCQRAGYGITSHNGHPVQVADYCDESGAVIAQKIRYPEKRFEIRGDASRMGDPINAATTRAGISPSPKGRLTVSPWINSSGARSQ